MLLLGIGGGLVVLVLAASLFLGGGGDGDGDDTALPTTPPATGPVNDDEADDGADDGDTVDGALDETFEVFSTKNPFEPLIVVGTGGTGTGGTGTGGTPTTAGPGGTVPPDGSGTTPTTTAGDGASGGGATEPRSRERVTLVDLFDGDDGERTATVRVNDTVHTVTAGDQFADRYQVVSLGEECGDFLFGDSPFELCVGEETLK
jgi:hypothetical protein